MPTIVLNAGHGENSKGLLDVGAVGKFLRECDVTLSVCFKIKSILEQYNITALMTRTENTLNTSLSKAVDFANNNKADYFVSVHCNSVADPSAHGTETFHLTGSAKGQVIATNIQNELIQAINLYNRGVKTANYYVLRNTNMPATLVELAFISNPTEENLLASDDFQNKCALAIAKGILKTLRIQYVDKGDVKKVKGIILHGGSIDQRAAEYLSDYLQLPICHRDYFKEYDLVESIYVVGGTWKPTDKAILIAGDSRYSTCQRVLDFIKNGRI